MIRTFIAAAALSFAAQGACAAEYDKQNNHYTVSIDAAKQRVHVEANVFIQGKELALYGVDVLPTLKNGQAEFIEKLQIRDAKGQPVSFKDKGEGEWDVDGDQRVHISYDVRLDHDKYDWPGGLEEIMYKTEEGVMAVGNTLFIVPGDKMPGKTEVEFKMPAGWKANTPWSSTATPNTFLVNSRREMVNNVLFLGTARSEQFESGGVKLNLVMGERYWKNRDAFIKLIDRQLAAYLKLFGGPPVADRYMIVINQGDTGDGGAFLGSFSQYLKDDGSATSRPIWGRVMAHELLHFWNGHSLKPKDGNEEWFKEGVTDYLTVMSMARNGEMSREFLMQQLENLARGQNVARNVQGLKVTIREAVKDKHKNWLLVYGGGAIAGLTMDVELRKATQDRVGLEQLMLRLYAEFGHLGKEYTQADIVRAGKEVSGVDLEPILNRIVASDKAVDLAPAFQAIGLTIENFGMLETYVLRSPKATDAERKRFSAIYGMPY